MNYKKSVERPYSLYYMYFSVETVLLMSWQQSEGILKFIFIFLNINQHSSWLQCITACDTKVWLQCFTACDTQDLCITACDTQVLCITACDTQVLCITACDTHVIPKFYVLLHVIPKFYDIFPWFVFCFCF